MAKDQLGEQNMHLEPLSSWKLKTFEELWPGAKGEDQNMYFLYIRVSPGVWYLAPSFSGSWSATS